MPANANGPRHGLSTIKEPAIADEMAAFDELPEPVRDALNTFPLRASAIEIRDQINGGISVGEILARKRANLRVFPLSFVRPIRMKERKRW